MNEKLVPKLQFEFSSEWENKKLKDIIQISKEKYNPELDKTNYKCIELEHLSQGSGLLLGYTDSVNQNSIKNRFHNENILFGKLRPYLEKYYFPNFEGVCSSEIWVFDTKEYPKYIYYLIQTKRFLDIANVSSGSKMPRSDWNFMKDFNFPIPNIKTQKETSNFFSAIDKKIELLEKKHHQYNDFKKYLMQQIFAQKLRFADCTDEWKVCKFKDLGTVKSGVGFSNKYQGHLDLDYNVYKVSDMNLKGNEKVMTKSNNTIDDSILNDMGAKLIREPSIIFAKVGEAIFLNRKRIAKPHFLIDNNMMAFSPNNNVDLEFMYYLTTSINFGKYAQIGALPSYNASDIYSIKCKIPPLEEQKRIGNLLSLADNKITNCSNQINNVLNFKRGLLQQMFV